MGYQMLNRVKPSITARKERTESFAIKIDIYRNWRCSLSMIDDLNMSVLSNDP